MARPTRLIRAYPRPEAGGVDYDNNDSGLSADTIQEAIDELVALIGPGGTEFTLVNEGGQDKVNPRGNMGSTETIDPTDGNEITGTLDADCTITLSSAPTTRDSDPSSALLTFWLTVGSGGGHTPTFAATGGTFAWEGGVTPTFPEDEDDLYRVVVHRVPGTTNDWVGVMVGSGGSGSLALDDLTDVTITAVQEDDTLRYVGAVWVNDNRRWEAVTDGEDVFVWDGDDLVHEWEAY